MNKDQNTKFKLVFECPQRIPCNPCADACPFGAISLSDEDISSIPSVDETLCKGCNYCLTVCPGQAIYSITNSEDYSIITFPFEFYPYPKVGDTVTAVNRIGEIVCDAEVVRFINIKKYNETALLSIKVPKSLSDKVRFIKLKNGDENE